MTATASKPRIELSQESLQAALSDVVPVIRRTTSLPVLSTVRWDGARLIATDLDSFVTRHLGGETLPAVCVPGTKLAEVVKSLSGNVVLEWDERSLTLKAGRDRFRLLGIPATEFPLTPTVTTPPVTLPADVLVEGLGRCRYAASRAESRPILNGLHLMCRDGALMVEASDSYIYARRTLLAKAPAQIDCILPSPAVDRLVALLDMAKDGAEVAFAVSENFCLFAVEGLWTLHSRLVDGPFPNTDPIVAGVPKGLEIAINSEEWAGALSRVRAMAPSINLRTSIRLEDGTAYFGSRDADIGEGAVEVGYKGEDGKPKFTSAINASLLRLSLVNLGSGEVTLRLEARKPFYLTNRAGDIAIAMPLMSLKRDDSARPPRATHPGLDGPPQPIARDSNT